MSQTILDVRDLKCHFQTRKGLVKAVDGVNLQVNEGEILALVGESGCGKSVTSQAIMRLIGQKKHERVEGSIRFKGEELLTKTEKEMRRLRGNRLAMIFQDPMTSLNPAYTVGNQIAEVLKIHQHASNKEAWSTAIDMLHKVGIPAPEIRVYDYPHQFSGGMRQRVVIAMALAANPDLLIADEPTTALDVTIQAQILNLIKELREEMGAGILLITHDLGVVAEVCDRVAVMYAGRIVEQASVQELFARPRHPYTQGLLASLPQLGQRKRLRPIAGQPPNLYALPSGCLFAERCPHVHERCHEEAPPLKGELSQHQLACWLEEGAAHV